MHTHRHSHTHIYASRSQPAPCEKVLICILLLTWRDTQRETERESVCVNQCNGAKTSVALKREQTCGGQDMIFFFSFHAEKQRYSTSVTAGRTIAPTARQRKRNLKGKKGNKGDREEVWQSGRYSTHEGLRQLSVLFLCFSHWFLLSFVYFNFLH